jgi:putative hydrolase of the HAD superfamily
MTTSGITTLFLDIGGVLLTNGWDRKARRLAAETFHLDYGEMDERHHLTFDTYEEGKLDLEEYLKRVVFYEPRAFTPEDFKTFMYAQSKPYPEMIAMISQIKQRYHPKIAVVSNEGRELTKYRIRKFALGEFVDFFISSSFVHFRKPDADIYRIALDMAQSAPEQVLYIEDRQLFVEVAQSLGLHAIRHVSPQQTALELAKCNFVLDDR